MKEVDIQQIWADAELQLQQAQTLNLQSWALHFQVQESLQKEKTDRHFRELIRFKMKAVIAGIFYALLLGFLLSGNHFRNPYFSFSIMGLLLFDLYAVVVYLYQIWLIGQIRLDQPLVRAQQQISRLQVATVDVVRVLWLQTPLYCTWFWDASWVSLHNTRFLYIALPATLLFTTAGIYLFRELKLENLNRPWIRKWMMTGPEYSTLVQAKALLDDIQSLRTEKK
jgi:hypothetical protein